MKAAGELEVFPGWMAGRAGYAERIRELFRRVHEEKAMRYTRQREMILEMLLGARRHLGLEDIYQALKSKGVGRVTVFRALKMLEENRLVDRVGSVDGRPRYEVKFERPHHDHLICVGCGRIKEVQWPQNERIQKKACRTQGFEPLFHRHEVFGRCAECQKKAGRGGGSHPGGSQRRGYG